MKKMSILAMTIGLVIGAGAYADQPGQQYPQQQQQQPQYPQQPPMQQGQFDQFPQGGCVGGGCQQQGCFQQPCVPNCGPRCQPRLCQIQTLNGGVTIVDLSTNQPLMPPTNVQAVQAAAAHYAQLGFCRTVNAGMFPPQVVQPLPQPIYGPGMNAPAVLPAQPIGGMPGYGPRPTPYRRY
jgi:hypothetical protein